MKKGINFILIVVFILVIAVIILLFAADLQFNSAKRLESIYLWQEAEGKYRLAIKLDPFNAQYLAGYGNFLREKSVYQEDRIAWLKMAEELYGRALELNPRCAEYAVSSGQVKLELFLSDKDKFKDRLSLGLDALKRALENDPNGFNTAYSAGYAGMTVWDNLNAVEQEWVLDRLKYSLKISPEYGEHIYPYLWQVTKDSRLLRKIRPEESVQEKKEKLKRIGKLKNDYRNKLKLVEMDGNLLFQTDWQGKAGENIYENGNMYWTGTIDKVVNVPKGKANVKIQAKGSPANNMWPYMLVELDGEEIGEAFIDSPEWKEIWGKMHSLILPIPEIPKINFDKQMVLAVFMGEKRSGGYDIKISKITKTEEKILVEVVEKEPPPESFRTMALTSPYHVVVIKKYPLAVNFQGLQNSQEK